VLLKNLELKVEMAKPDEASFEEFQQTLTTPLPPWKAGSHGGPLCEERSASTWPSDVG